MSTESELTIYFGNERKIILDHDEAKELYDELHKYFGQSSFFWHEPSQPGIWPSGPTYTGDPTTPDMTPIITCEDKNENKC